MIRRELTIFLIVGLLAVLVDFLIYHCLIYTELIRVDIAKAISFVIGTIFAYFANCFWTFAHKPHIPGNVWRFILLYAVTLSMNVLVNAQILELFNGGEIAIQVAFLLATGVSASLNFLGMKLFVFRSRVIMEI